MTLSLALLAVLVAQTPATDLPAGPPTPEAIARAVRQLGDDDYAVRQRASQWLWAAGAAAEPAIREALKSADVEVVVRCRDLLDKIPYGITPDTPRRFVELVAAARAGGLNAWPGVVAELLDLGPRGLEIANKLVDRAAVSAGQYDAMRAALDRESWRVVPALVAERQFDQAESLLERGAIAGVASTRATMETVGGGGINIVPADVAAVRHYAAFLSQRGKLDAQLQRWRALAEGPDTKNSLGSNWVVAYLARIHGDWPLARSAADKLNHADLREAILFDQGAWADLIGVTPTNYRTGVIPTGLKALYTVLAGKSADVAAAFAEVKKLPLTRSPTAAPPMFRFLMYAQRPAEAMTFLEGSTELDFVIPRFEVLCQQHRYAEAFKLLDRPPGEDGLRTLQRWQWDMARVRVFHQRGEADKVRDVLRPLAALDPITSSETSAAQDLVDQLVAFGLTDDAVPIAAALLNGGAPPADVFGKLFPKAPLAAEIWWPHLRTQHPAEPMRATVARLPALLDARLAGPDGQALLEAAAKAAQSQPPADADRWLQGLGEACQTAKLTDAAKRFYEEAIAKNDSAAAWLKLGDLHADGGRWADAATAYERSWRKEVKQPLPLWLAGLAKKRSGATDGAEFMELAHTITLGDEDLRSTFSEELMKRTYLGPEPAEAARRERQLVLRLVNLYRPPPVTTDRPDRGRNTQGLLSSDSAAFTDRLEAADGTQRYLVRMWRTNAYFKKNEAYLSVPHRYYVDRARGLLAKGDVDGALREAAAAQEVLPGHTSPATHLVPELVRLGRTADADKMYGAAATVLDQLCRDLPNSASFHNSRAWLAAHCRRDLDDALTHARKAVELDPKSATYRETLAEVHFQRGERAAAVERITQALELEPKNGYYVQQKRRMEAGDPKAPLPEGR